MKKANLEGRNQMLSEDVANLRHCLDKAESDNEILKKALNDALCLLGTFTEGDSWEKKDTKEYDRLAHIYNQQIEEDF